MHDDDWDLTGISVGDGVIIDTSAYGRNEYTSAVVIKITPTQITTRDKTGTVERYNLQTNKRIGDAGSWTPAYVLPPTLNNRQKMQESEAEQERVKLASELSHLAWYKMDLDTLRRIKALIAPLIQA